MNNDIRPATGGSYERARHINSATLSLLILAATIGCLFYAAFLLNPKIAGSLVAYTIVVVAELFLILQALIACWTILAGGHNPRDFAYFQAKRSLVREGISRANLGSLLYLAGRPASVDVFVTVYGEPLAVIAKTVAAARNLTGAHKTYILDDGESDAVAQLARGLGVGYVRRTEHHSAKAGNINHALGLTQGEYFVIFDADHVPKPNFLVETLPFFQDKTVAFVQTPQFYTNTHNTIARGAGYAQALFYRFIMPGKNRFNAAFCVGTNVVFRRSAVTEIGGIYEQSNSEDIWTSLLLHERGHRSVFIPDVLAEGEAPDTIKTYVKQQQRWATGGFEILLKENPLNKNLSIDQKLQYLGTAMFYLNGVAMCLLFVLPALAIFFNLSPIALGIPVGQWLVHYAAFYGLQVFLAFYCMNGFKLETMILSAVSFPTYLKALANVVLGRQETWNVTGQRSSDSPFNYIVPQVLIFLFLVFTSAVGIWQVFTRPYIGMALVWNLLNTYFFGYFIRTAIKERRLARTAPQPVARPATLEFS